MVSFGQAGRHTPPPHGRTTAAVCSPARRQIDPSFDTGTALISLGTRLFLLLAHPPAFLSCSLPPWFSARLGGWAACSCRVGWPRAPGLRPNASVLWKCCCYVSPVSCSSIRSSHLLPLQGITSPLSRSLWLRCFHWPCQRSVEQNASAQRNCCCAVILCAFASVG